MWNMCDPIWTQSLLFEFNLKLGFRPFGASLTHSLLLGMTDRQKAGRKTSEEKAHTWKDVDLR